MLAALGYRSRAALIDAIVPASIRRTRAARACRRPRPRPRRSRSCAVDRGEEPGVALVHRPGLLRHAHAGRDPAQRAREPGVVHGVHAVPAGDLAGPARSAGQFPDDDLRPYRHGDRQRVDARRGDRRRRGDDALPARRHGARATRFFVADDVFAADARCRAHARASRSASRSSPAPRPMRRDADAFAVLLQYPGRRRRRPRLSRARGRRCTRRRRHCRRRRRPARAHAADAAGRMGRRRRRRLGAALRRADGLRRPARGLPRHARRIQALDARPARRRHASTPTAARPTAWRCRRASSTSAARRRRRTSARRRCCSP